MKTQNFFVSILFGNLVIAFCLMAYMYQKHSPGLMSSSLTAKNTTNSNIQPPQAPVAPALASLPSAPLPVAAPTESSQASSPAAQLMCYEAQVNDPAVKAAFISTLEQQNISPIEQKTVSQISKHQVYWGLGSTIEVAQAKLSELKALGVFQTPNIQLYPVNKQFALNISTVSTKEEAMGQVEDMSKKAASFGGTWFTEPLQSSASYVSFHLTPAALNTLEKKTQGIQFQKCAS